MVASYTCPLPGITQTCHLGMCPNWELNLQPFAVRDGAPTNWATGPGLGFIFKSEHSMSVKNWIDLKGKEGREEGRREEGRTSECGTPKLTYVVFLGVYHSKLGTEITCLDTGGPAGGGFTTWFWRPGSAMGGLGLASLLSLDPPALQADPSSALQAGLCDRPSVHLS